MAYEKKPGDISIFKNDRKEKDTHPDYRVIGLDLNGDKIKGALWLKTDRNGNKFMAGRIEHDVPRDDFRSNDASGVSGRGGGGGYPQSGRGGDSASAYDLNDDIPF
jgi:hypothetical protein